MSSYSENNPDKLVQAMVLASQKILEVMGSDLNSHFMKHGVSLLNVLPAKKFGPDSVTLLLSGKEENIKTSLQSLKKVCYGKEMGFESSPIKSIPPKLKHYLEIMTDEEKFNKTFLFCSKEYIENCKKNNIAPHPEVIESIKG